MTRSSYRPLVPRSSNNSLDNRESGDRLCVVAVERVLQNGSALCAATISRWRGDASA
ncbi:unnamed protein product [Plutella xylostella]|uniref:(diamondback moth) hypothetical protein n=1 Tax=Plutella xylostella TaxID=51655 RepID=A0A8S4FZL2_PLUXY|nr:unnamed protein product [Plutella xylostella]